MHRGAMSAFAFAVFLGAAQAALQNRAPYSILGSWKRINDKPKAVMSFRADGTWSMHVVGARGFTADLSGTYILKDDVLIRKTLKTVLSKKRPALHRLPFPHDTTYKLKWFSKDRFALSEIEGPKSWHLEELLDHWARLAPIYQSALSRPPSATARHRKQP